MFHFTQFILMLKINELCAVSAPHTCDGRQVSHFLCQKVEVLTVFIIILCVCYIYLFMEYHRNRKLEHFYRAHERILIVWTGCCVHMHRLWIETKRRKNTCIQHNKALNNNICKSEMLFFSFYFVPTFVALLHRHWWRVKK